MKLLNWRLCAALGVGATVALTAPVQAKMPKDMTWTAYGTTSSGYAPGSRHRQHAEEQIRRHGAAAAGQE